MGAKEERERLTVSEEIGKHPAWFRLNDQLELYDEKSGSKQRWYKRIKSAQLVMASSIPVFSLVGIAWGRLITAVLGAGVVILEGIQQLGQFNDLWINYRSTVERLKHEKYLFLAGSGPYRGLAMGEALTLLAERVEEQVSTEHAKWINETRQAGQREQS